MIVLKMNMKLFAPTPKFQSDTCFIIPNVVYFTD